MNRVVKSCQIISFTLLAGCIPTNINTHTAHYQYTFIEQNSNVVVCENKAILKLTAYELPMKIDVDKASNDRELTELLLGHIERLREDLLELSSVDYQCTLVK